MRHYVVFLKDYEQHKDIVCILPERSSAIALCATLNAKCEKAEHPMDFDELMDFAQENRLRLDKRMIAEVNRMGSHFSFEEAQYNWSIDYSVLNASWDDTKYDYFTSDLESYYDYDYDEYDEFDDLDEFDIPLWIDTTRANVHKVAKWHKEPTRPKWYDPKFAHPDVAHNLAYWDPIHRHCHWEGYSHASNKIRKMIIKLAKGSVQVGHVCYKIRNNMEYKKCAIYRNAAEWYLNGLEGRDSNLFDEPFSGIRTLHDYVIIDSMLWSREEAKKYVGYEYKTTRYYDNGKWRKRHEEI